MNLAVLALLLGSGFVRAGVDIAGDRVVNPVNETDPSPINEFGIYIPDEHDCPLPCFDYSNINSWIPYLSVDRLQRCTEPLLLQLSVQQLLNDTSSATLIRTCSLAPGDSVPLSSNTGSVENPKYSGQLAQPSLDIALACNANGTVTNTSMELVTSSAVAGSGDDAASMAGNVTSLLQGLTSYFNDADNCDENFVFAYFGQAVIGAYIGPGLGKATVESAVKALSQRITQNGSVSKRMNAQICSQNRTLERTFGISIDTTGDLAGVQRTALQWSRGECPSDGDLSSTGTVPAVSLYEIRNTTVVATNSTTTRPNLIRTLPPGFFSNRTTTTRVPKARRTALGQFMHKRATCRYIQVQSGDGCSSLASRCQIPGPTFEQYNSYKQNLCSTLQVGDYVCCSAGDPYVAPTPQPGSDGICATHLVQNGDTCGAIASRYNIKVSDLDTFNAGKTWLWSGCSLLQPGFTVCISNGYAPLPPAQAGTECGPTVPGTKRPAGGAVNLAELNPCPLKTCCSNWGFCGIFAEHCDKHDRIGGGPGSKADGFTATCVSGCGNEIKTNSGKPAFFGRIGYYESYNMERPCLWLKAKDANTDGSYTHIHWAFAEIDPNGWKVVLKDPNGQFNGFKALLARRIISFGGWAYSTEPATYNILRSAIINNGATFAQSIVDYIVEQSLDGVDIDWEYPGAPDILVNGQVIGQKGDGAAYLNFLKILRQKMPAGKTVSIAAPASYWYLKAFPIDQIAQVVDYIVYMTYDLHGQWDYGKPNSFDGCKSGKCVRSHVNLTETRSSLSLITKAGVPNNKIFVGEASYGRSFHLANPLCFGETCEFTGAIDRSDATPGRCTRTRGYLAKAEIDEIIRSQNVLSFHDGTCNTDVLIYNGDYIAYMSDTTKSTRRSDWAALNFAGAIDWAVDLQRFGPDDINVKPDKNAVTWCVEGYDKTGESAQLCQVTCSLGFCPVTLCECTREGPDFPLAIDTEVVPGSAFALNKLNVELSRLCRVACSFGYCPHEICQWPVDPTKYWDDAEEGSARSIRNLNNRGCITYKKPAYFELSTNDCKKQCQADIDAGVIQDDTIRSWGCGAFNTPDKTIQWEELPGNGMGPFTRGECICNSAIADWLVDQWMDIIIIAAQFACQFWMATLKLVIDIGTGLFTGGRLSGVLDTLATVVQIVNYVYTADQDPQGALEWYLSPCGTSEDLLPEGMKKAYDILSTVAGSLTSFKTPSKIGKGSGRKGDAGNPSSTDRSGRRRDTENNKRCQVPPQWSTQLSRGGSRNTLLRLSCSGGAANGRGGTTIWDEMVITSAAYAANAQPTNVRTSCSARYPQACAHYSSAARVQPAFATLQCPDYNGNINDNRFNGRAKPLYRAQHLQAGWEADLTETCDIDEWPPAYLMTDYIQDTYGQSMRYLPANQNRGAQSHWAGVCFRHALGGLSVADIDRAWNAGGAQGRPVAQRVYADQRDAPTLIRESSLYVTASYRPNFAFSAYPAAMPSDGLNVNPCWPSARAANDPGYALLNDDPWYNGRPRPYRYDQPYAPGVNGV